MERFKFLFLYLRSRCQLSMRRMSHAIGSRRVSGAFVPVARTSFWTVGATDQPRQPLAATRRAAPRKSSAPTDQTRGRVRDAFSGFVLWFSLLFSAALIGTFIVLGAVMAYALLMSLLGH